MKIKRNSIVGQAYKLTTGTSLDNDNPKVAAGNGSTNTKTHSPNPLPIKQGAIRRSRFATGDVTGRDRKKVQQYISDYRRTENGKKLTPYEFITGKDDISTSDAQYKINNAVGKTAIGSHNFNQNDKKRTKTGEIVRTRADEQPIFSFKTKNGVITLPKTIQLRPYADKLGVSRNKIKPGDVRNAMQSSIKHAETIDDQAQKVLGLKQDETFGGIVKPLAAGNEKVVDTSVKTVAGRVPETTRLKAPILSQLGKVHAMNEVVSGLKDYQKEYAKDMIALDVEEEKAAAQVVKDKEESARRISINEQKFLDRQVRTPVTGRDPLQDKADLFSGAKTANFVANDKSGQPKQSNEIKPASKNDRKVSYKNGKFVVKKVGDRNPVLDTEVKANTNPVFKKEMAELDARQSMIDKMPDNVNLDTYSDIAKKVDYNTPNESPFKVVYSRLTGTEADYKSVTVPESTGKKLPDNTVLVSPEESKAADSTSSTLDIIKKSEAKIKELEAAIEKGKVAMSEARAQGDASENADLDASKEQLAGYHTQLANLKDLISKTTKPMTAKDARNLQDYYSKIVSGGTGEYGRQVQLGVKGLHASDSSRATGRPVQWNPNFRFFGNKSSILLGTMANVQAGMTSPLKAAAQKQLNKEVKTLKKNYTGKVSGIEAYMPSAGAGHKTILDSTAIQMAKQAKQLGFGTQADVDAAIKKVEAQGTSEVNANTSVNKAGLGVNVVLKAVGGSDLTKSQRKTIMKTKRPGRRTPNPVFVGPDTPKPKKTWTVSTSLADTIAIEDVAEKGIYKKNNPSDTPLTGTGQEVNKTQVVKSRRRKNR